jgi:hypothetical protein
MLYFSSIFFLHLFSGKTERFVSGLLGCIVAGLVIWWFLKMEKSSFAEIGLVWEKGTLKRFFTGILNVLST